MLTVVPAFILNAAPEAGGVPSPDQVPPAHAPSYVAVPAVRVFCAKLFPPIAKIAIARRNILAIILKETVGKNEIGFV
jgi:hypothetical protein